MKVVAVEASLNHYLPLVEKVITQSQVRIFHAEHGPHLYISYRGKNGKTTGYYVPHQAEAQIRQGIDAWSRLQDRLRELAAKIRSASSRPRPKNNGPFHNSLQLAKRRARGFRNFVYLRVIAYWVAGQLKANLPPYLPT